MIYGPIISQCHHRIFAKTSFAKLYYRHQVAVPPAQPRNRMQICHSRSFCKLGICTWTIFFPMCPKVSHTLSNRHSTLMNPKRSQKFSDTLLSTSSRKIYHIFIYPPDHLSVYDLLSFLHTNSSHLFYNIFIGHQTQNRLTLFHQFISLLIFLSISLVTNSDISYSFK